MKAFTINFSLSDSEYLTAVRLIAGAVCSLREVDVDTVEDFKVCVTECANVLKNCGFESVKMSFAGGEKASCEVKGEGGVPKGGDNELSLALISALVAECDIKKDGDIISGLSITL